MASWQAHLMVLVLKFQVKRKLKRHVNIDQIRKTMAGISPKVPADVAVADARVGGVAGEWVRRKDGTAAPTLLYFHGGGYFVGSPLSHRPITIAYARLGFDVFVPDYRLAPEHPFPAAVEDGVSAFRGLVAAGTPAETMFVAGDSAGGGLALAMMLSLREAGEPLPAAAVLFSPWTDLAVTGDSVRTNEKRCAMFTADGIVRGTAVYLGGADPRTPLASPLYADLHGLPRLLIHAGSFETLRDDSTRLAERAAEAAVPCRIRLWPVVPHVWQIFTFLPETRASMQEAAAFLHG